MKTMGELDHVHKTYVYKTGGGKDRQYLQKKVGLSVAWHDIGKIVVAIVANIQKKNNSYSYCTHNELLA